MAAQWREDGAAGYKKVGGFGPEDIQLGDVGMLELLRRLRLGADCVVFKLPPAFHVGLLEAAMAAEGLGSVERTVKLHGHTQLVLVRLTEQLDCAAPS